jgi:hypothetical protein
MPGEKRQQPATVYVFEERLDKMDTTDLRAYLEKMEANPKEIKSLLRRSLKKRQQQR